MLGAGELRASYGRVDRHEHSQAEGPCGGCGCEFMCAELPSCASAGLVLVWLPGILVKHGHPRRYLSNSRGDRFIFAEYFVINILSFRGRFVARFALEADSLKRRISYVPG